MKISLTFEELKQTGQLYGIEVKETDNISEAGIFQNGEKIDLLQFAEELLSPDNIMEEVTLWYQVDENENMNYNHLEMGVQLGTYPKPKATPYTNQVAWSKLKWVKKLGMLDKNGVVHETGTVTN